MNYFPHILFCFKIERAGDVLARNASLGLGGQGFCVIRLQQQRLKCISNRMIGAMGLVTSPLQRYNNPLQATS